MALDPRQDPNRVEMDINTATFEDLAANPVLGEDGARAVIAARPFQTWDQVLRLPNFDHERLRNLKSTGAQIGSGDFRDAA